MQIVHINQALDLDLEKDQTYTSILCCGGRLGMIIEKEISNCGVWGAIANKMEASQETCFLGIYNLSLPPDYQTVCP